MARRRRYPRKSFDEVCRRLGYRQERELLEDLYVRSGLSIRAVGKIIDRSYSDVKYRLTMNGFALRERGGANRRRDG